MVPVLGGVASHNVCEEDRLGFEVIEFRRWGEVEPNDTQESCKEGFHDEVFWQVVRSVLIHE
jgi:hypothetical protein